MDKWINLKNQYDEIKPKVLEFQDEIKKQLTELFKQNSIPLAVPIESRVKNWESINNKIDRSGEIFNEITNVWDLVGLRAIFSFASDVRKARKLLCNEFIVVYERITGDELSPIEFGYQSTHFTLKLKSKWLAIPTWKDFGDIVFEIQIRTLSQHNWAAASRVLQYNQANAVPSTVIRALHRVAAVLEIVDLEFERVLQKKEEYVTQIDIEQYKKDLDIHILAKILDEYLPKENKILDEPYDELLQDLNKLEISKGSELINLITKNLQNAKNEDLDAVNAARSGDPSFSGQEDRIQKGVYYSHTGLIQNMLNLKYGMDWRKPNGH